MNVTKTEAKCSQLPVDSSRKEGSLQKNSAEHEGYAGAHSSERITENNITDANLSMENLLEQIVDRNNMNNAYKRVKSNKGAHGVDGMKVDELLQYLKENGGQLRQSILDGKHRPNPVRRVEIRKEDGKKITQLPAEHGSNPCYISLLHFNSGTTISYPSATQIMGSLLPDYR